MTNQTRTIDEINASLQRNNTHRAKAIADREFYVIMGDWDAVERAQRDVQIYDDLNDRFLDEFLAARATVVPE